MASNTPACLTCPKSHAAGARSTSQNSGANSTIISLFDSLNISALTLATALELPSRKTSSPMPRSNKWKRSWKKYFIELFYLHGYLILYYNYEGFVSLSTDHLEVGSHVKDIPQEYLRKKDLSSLPLMNIFDGSRISSSSSSSLGVGLLDLPAETPKAMSIDGQNCSIATTTLFHSISQALCVSISSSL